MQLGEVGEQGKIFVHAFAKAKAGIEYDAFACYSCEHGALRQAP